MSSEIPGLKFGVYLPPFGPLGDPRVLVQLAVRAENAGWDGVFLWDHVMPDDGFAITDPWACLAAMAQETGRIRLGPMVTPLPRRRPWVVARHAAAISQLSDGRFILGAGLGSDENGDFSRFGESAEPGIRAEKLDEALDIVRAMWAGEKYEHNGRHFRVSLEESEPTPYPIPIWLGSSASSGRTARRAARYDGLYANPGNKQLNPDDVAAILGRIRAAGLPEDRAFELAVRRHVSEPWLEKQPPVELGSLADAGLTWWMEGLIHYDELDYSLRIVDAGPPRE